MIEKIKKHKQIWIIAGVVLLIVAVALVIVLNSPKGNNEKKSGKDTISREKEDGEGTSASDEDNPYESETGLEVADPKEETPEREVPFVAPSDAQVKQKPQEMQGTQGTQGIGSDIKQEEKPDLDDTQDEGSKGKYGEFF